NQVYDDLAKGKLTQEQALEKIKAIKLKEQNSDIGNQASVLIAAPQWQAEAVLASANQSAFQQHHVVLCGLSSVDSGQLKSSLSLSQCVQFQANTQKNIADTYNDVAFSIFEVLQNILKGKPRGQVLVQLVIANDQEHSLHVGLSGLLKTAALENPQIVAQLILSNTNINTSDLTKQLQKDAAKSDDAVVKYENDIRYVQHWSEFSQSNNSENNPTKDTYNVVFKDHGVYLITGGLGGLGILFAKEIIKQTTKATIILTGRSQLTAKKKSTLDEISASGGKLIYRQLDIANLQQVKDLVATIQNEHKQLNGVIHSAGMTVDNFILKKTLTEFNQVLNPKVSGTFNLDQACQNVDLDFLVLFSSVASWLGNVGQADYAAANGFMDQFAVYRNQLVQARQRSGKTLSINWPLWQQG
ncbi:MAG: SDR family NAD(P)-dependent oxidoreductase, partial [Moraxellaceae bacterium]